jgi:hypothetical protein
MSDVFLVVSTTPNGQMYFSLAAKPQSTIDQIAKPTQDT